MIDLTKELSTESLSAHRLGVLTREHWELRIAELSRAEAQETLESAGKLNAKAASAITLRALTSFSTLTHTRGQTAALERRVQGKRRGRRERVCQASPHTTHTHHHNTPHTRTTTTQQHTHHTTPTHHTTDRDLESVFVKRKVNARICACQTTDRDLETKKCLDMCTAFNRP